jgi:hypothetical protein
VANRVEEIGVAVINVPMLPDGVDNIKPQHPGMI